MKLKRAADIQSLFFYIFFSLPLFYIFDHPVMSRTIRFSVLFGLLLLIFCVENTRQIFVHNMQSFRSSTKIALSLLFLLLVLSAAFAQHDWKTTLFGISPEYLGLVSWLAFIGLGVLFSNRLTELLAHKTTLLLSLVIIVLSLWSSYYEIFHGLRVPGLMFQATTMGMYAVCTGVLGFWQWRIAKTTSHKIWAIVLILFSTAIIILTQSRIALVACVIAYGIIAFHSIVAAGKRPRIALFALILLVSVTILPQSFSNYFARFQIDSVNNGVSYRKELYALTVKDVLRDNKLLGNGPSSLPESINDESIVPEDIQLSLKTGDIFLSSHNMFLDIGYCFGMLAALIVLAVTCRASFRPFYSTALPVELWLLFVIGILNALVNVTSLELTSWYFVLLIALIACKETSNQKYG